MNFENLSKIPTLSAISLATILSFNNPFIDKAEAIEVRPKTFLDDTDKRTASGGSYKDGCYITSEHVPTDFGVTQRFSQYIKVFSASPDKPKFEKCLDASSLPKNIQEWEKITQSGPIFLRLEGQSPIKIEYLGCDKDSNLAIVFVHKAIIPGDSGGIATNGDNQLNSLVESTRVQLNRVLMRSMVVYVATGQIDGNSKMILQKLPATVSWFELNRAMILKNYKQAKTPKQQTDAIEKLTDGVVAYFLKDLYNKPNPNPEDTIIRQKLTQQQVDMIQQGKGTIGFFAPTTQQTFPKK